MRKAGSAPRILIVVQNLPVPLDRRVWLECQALVAAGYRVSVICPKGPDDRRKERLDGVLIRKYAPPPPAAGAVGYLVEFVYAWVRTALLSVVVASREGFDVLQACNPPDTYWALGRLYQLAGKKFVYDQHDLNPEVFLSRFGQPKGAAARLQYRLLLWLERRTFQTADRVISTNESYRSIAQRRGGVDRARTTVVRSGPDTAQMRPVHGFEELRRGRAHLLVYLGIMGPQDGVDTVLKTLDVLVHNFGREDISVALLGFGDTYDELVALTAELELQDYVTFTGRVGPREITEYLSAASLGLSPDPLNPLNDVSTMNKTMEYMSFALPVVAFDLAETRVSGGDAVHYVQPADSADQADTEAAIRRYAQAVADVLDDPERRGRMAVAGRRRAESDLDWRPQAASYLSVFDDLTGHRSPQPATAELAGGENAWGHRLVEVGDDSAVEVFAAGASAR